MYKNTIEIHCILFLLMGLTFKKEKGIGTIDRRFPVMQIIEKRKRKTNRTESIELVTHSTVQHSCCQTQTLFTHVPLI